jgi:hypothetical protein
MPIRSKPFLLLCFAIFFTACSADTVSRAVDVNLGDRLDSFLPFSLSDGSILFKDEQVDKLHQISGDDPMRLVSSKPYSDQSIRVVPHPSGIYSIYVKDRTVGIMRADGVFEAIPQNILGELSHIAFDFASHTYGVVSQGASILLFQTNEDGVVLNSFLGGPQITEGHFYVSAEILNAQSMLTVAADKAYAVVDIAETFASQSWVATKEEVAGAGVLTWLSKVPDHPNKILLKGDDKLRLFDLETKSILGEFNTLSRALYNKRWPMPVYVSASNALKNDMKIHYVDASGTLKEAVASTFELSHTDYISSIVISQSVARLVSKRDGACRVIIFRTSDYLVVKDRRFDGAVDCVVMDDDNSFVNFDTGLGLVQVRSLNDGSVKRSLAKFNIP